jgi:signal transduction histidine kinase
MQRQRPGPFAPLERKLPLLIGAVVAVLLLAVVGITQLELRQNAMTAAGERLERTAEQLGDLLDAVFGSREALLAEVVADPAITGLLAGRSADVPAAVEAIERLRMSTDAELPIELRDRDGRLAAEVPGASAPADLAASLPPETMHSPDRIDYSPLFEQQGAGAYWVSVPVVDSDGTVLGHVRQQRSIGSRAVAEQIEQLVGDDLSIFLANTDGSSWIGLDGSAAGSAQVDAVGETRVRHDGSVDQLSYAAQLSRTPWVMVTEIPARTALARTNALARRMALIGIILLLLGGAAAWLVSRRVTAPLRRLASAADAIAGGDYSRRTGIERNDEIGQLASSFDLMAARIDTTHAELATRYDEAQTLALELESANRRLQLAVEEVEAARHEAQQASRAKSEFLATMSHEIRTPINAMIGYADLLEMGVPGPLTQQQSEYMERIRRSGTHLISLINDVLDFAKVESGQMRVAHDVRASAAVIDTAVSMLQGRAAAKGVQLRVECAGDTLFLGDAQRVQQILLNLLANALKFTDAGGTISVSCECREREEHPAGAPDAAATAWTCITVHDSGPGIEPGQHERIFEPFVQGESGYTRSHGGTGLGLAISRSLARMMNGDLTVDCSSEAGARFTLWLPHPSAARVAAGG